MTKERDTSPTHGLQKNRPLEKRLAERPDKTDLAEKNVLITVYAKPAELSKNQLEDKLNAVLAHRPEAEKLVQEGILTSLLTSKKRQQSPFNTYKAQTTKINQFVGFCNGMGSSLQPHRSAVCSIY
ncbi:uncharacterized protein PGTG_18189 [Puccinia graminis f. sp. tritici CRL 75-36-700-3]|uniref:Uncharacterized protein n=1 Tax=Puccinia graminis f. sp. tritici (strain CRL 75-36-700-3 / race SCCL) TaxID=418459 RepID=E3KW45_PUCGT|nr:uncharacterized protein PGTG_14098 [Puccinia graminis f. sp. tritici CRL 75-36-700-3]XP_003337093.1 uncharacterized protein PGTG_18189 [Puccinia graminis f. sp. tritici CRL 75-36-700-3]EFP88520.1 hypothetical protein PGTG_14098 [Puccinia graminis f. sp. tritici CRL 75-36-700-3]EFP92674.1 hypothetical protein PGTG_18189 [Puccinia graminis f. sp. tritici CRL 75-36-700-3]